ncbi:MAG TPA: ATP-binding protein, partial [Kofleriaceae bacterium]|nr:ATP-binding protein [Kofleriaceae bacterium]
AFGAWAVIPFVAGEVAIGGVSFSFATERSFSEDDRALLVAMTGQASLALERCKLLDAERRARAQAEAAQLRERQLHVTAAKLSRAATIAEVGAVIAHAGAETCGAYAALAALRGDEVMRVVGSCGARNAGLLARVATVPVSAAIPMAECVRRGEIVWASTPAETSKRWPAIADAMREAGIRSCGAVPFSFEGRTVGALGFACDEERLLSAPDREQLTALAQLAAQAFERARLYEQLQTREEQLRTALAGARAGTWSLDLRTMTATRDASYAEVLGLAPDEQVKADFGSVHPDDVEIARAAFERTLREGVPYEPEVRVRRGDGRYVWTRSHARLLRGSDGQPDVLAGLVFDIDEAKQAALRAEAERRINNTLYEISAQFARELDPHKLVQMIVDETARIVGAATGAFYAEDGTVHATTGEPPSSDAGSRLALPVATGGQNFGTVVFTHREADRFTDQHERLAAAIATQAATALENARLYQTVRSQNDELEVAVDRARTADRRKDEFLAMLGHELRNPLAPITTALELMDLKSTDTLLGKEREVIRRQVEHLSRLVDDLLDISRITGGKVALATDVVELSTVIAKGVEMASPLLEKRSHPLTVDVPREGLPVLADPTRLAQVFQNLLTNAAKYSEPGSPIAVRARRTGGMLIVEVVDHGMGIPPELLPNLFDMFVQGARAIDRSEGGLGLGLTIAKSLCELHGGTLDATSAGPGGGSTFTIRLPASTLPVAPSNRPTARMHKLVKSARVLVVDDNVDSAQMLDAFLRELGHEPVVAHDGPGALEVLDRFVPDVAVLDIGLPVMDGYELARRLRERLGPEKLRLIAMTGYGQESDKQRATEAGFDHHLVKPIALDALTSLLMGE